MRYVKTVHLKEKTTAYTYFYRMKVQPFRRLSADQFKIDDTYYQIWTFNSRTERNYIAAFPVTHADHFHIFELALEETGHTQFKKESKLSDFSTKKIMRYSDLREEIFRKEGISYE
ncbi:hypothetical protein [Candidatus Enterococcus clewellii]|uniref:Uncharacterized protein n=1 Tax=Candidatus Enterococcus clewellii TaxID=1834193 RepID=A0A242K4Z9_9ENTE|nr:hypothetical protein [Enterococcus sp. 9E7_DIV0242]OTP13454.1 hypothetical protein A5888_002932 [Enterococcus sp. 9E7_DIV0242]